MLKNERKNIRTPIVYQSLYILIFYFNTKYYYIYIYRCPLKLRRKKLRKFQIQFVKYLIPPFT